MCRQSRWVLNPLLAKICSSTTSEIYVTSYELVAHRGNIRFFDVYRFYVNVELKLLRLLLNVSGT